MAGIAASSLKTGMMMLRSGLSMLSRPRFSCHPMFPRAFGGIEGRCNGAYCVNSAHELEERVVRLDIVAQQPTRRAQIRPGQRHLKHHVFVGVIAVVQKDVERRMALKKLR